MSHSALAVPVESVMTDRIVQILEQIPMSEVRSIAAKYDFSGFPVVSRNDLMVAIAPEAV